MSRPRGTRTPNLRIHAECSIHLTMGARHFLSHVFEYWLWRYRYSCSKVNIWNVNSQRATAFIFNSRTDVLVKVSKFLRQKCLDLKGTQTPNLLMIHAGYSRHLSYQGQTIGNTNSHSITVVQLYWYVVLHIRYWIVTYFVNYLPIFFAMSCIHQAKSYTVTEQELISAIFEMKIVSNTSFTRDMEDMLSMSLVLRTQVKCVPCTITLRLDIIFHRNCKIVVRTNYIKQWEANMANLDRNPILRTYKYIKWSFKIEPYLYLVKDHRYRHAIAHLGRVPIFCKLNGVGILNPEPA